MKSVPLCAAELWEKVCLKVNKAVVFIDNPSAEILHWHGGLNLLVKSGAEDVREFSPFEVSNSNAQIVSKYKFSFFLKRKKITVY